MKCEGIGRCQDQGCPAHYAAEDCMKDLIEKLRLMAFESLDNDKATMLHKAADALEAKAAPVGEREAAIDWYNNADWGNERFKDGVVRGFQAGAAYQRAQQPQSAGAVSAQARFRRPEKGMPAWSVWQQTSIKPNIPAWSIDSAGYEVEYRLLYTTPQLSAGVVMPDDMRELLEEIVDIHRRRGVVLTIHIEQIADILARLNGKEVGRG